jgi:hypothetical protein
LALVTLTSLCLQLLKKNDDLATPADLPLTPADLPLTTSTETGESLTTSEPLVVATTTTVDDVTDKEDIVALDEENDSEPERQQLKRDLKVAKNGGGLLQPSATKQSYNNWFGRNDWSRRIQKVQGRIRFKNQNN